MNTSAARLALALGLIALSASQLWANVVITSPTGGNNVSTDKALNSTNGVGFTSLGSIVITEGAATDLAAGNNQTLILTVAAGWQFNPGVGTVSFTGSRNITAAAIAVTASTATVTFSANGIDKLDVLTIAGLQVQSLDGANVPGAEYIRRRFENPGTAVVVGIEADFTTFGLLNQVAGTAKALAMDTQPGATASAGALFSPQPKVKVVDQFGNLRDLDNTTVVTAARAGGSGTLQGTLTRTVVYGVASYTNLSHNVAGTITIQFTAPGLTSVTSAPILVNPAPADRLVFTTQPGSASAGVPFSIQPVLKTQDRFGSDSTVGLPASKPVTVTLSSGSGTVSGTTTLDIGTAAGNGMVGFSNLQIDAAGASKQLTASASGMTNAVSAPFGVSAALYSKLQLLVPGETAVPGTSTGKTGTPNPQSAGTPFNVTVNAVDANWNLVNTISDTVSLTSSAGTATLPPNAALVLGTKTFSVTLNTIGSSTLTATDLTDISKTPNTSPAITVGGGTPRKLAIQSQPSATATAGVAFAQQPVVRVEDAGGNLVTADNGRVITVARSLGTAAVQGTLTATTINGLATFTNLSYNRAESITLNFTATGLTNVTSGNVAVGANAAQRLAFTTQPGGASRIGSALATQPVVQAQDQFGNASSVGLPANLNMSLALTGGSGSLLGTTTLDLGTGAGNGVATFTDVGCSDTGTNKQLTASAAGLTSAISTAFTVGGLVTATGAGAVSADTVGGAYTTVTGPAYYEAAPADVKIGTIILNAPAGFVFDTGGIAPTVLITRLSGSGAIANNINGVASGTAAAITSRTSSQITFTVSSTSAAGVTCALTWQSVRVRPSAGTPLASGNLTKTGTSVMATVTNGSTSFGTLSEVVGLARQLAFVTQPGGATAGAPFGIQPVLRTRDQFGNSSTVGLAASKTVTLALTSGTGSLLGPTSLDLGTAAGNGVATFTDVQLNSAGTNKQLTATASGFTNGLTSVFTVNAAAADHLAIQIQPPANATAGIAFSPQPVIQIQDYFGNLCSADSTSVITASRNAGSGSLQGSLTVAAVNGIARFTNLSHAVATNLTLDFTCIGLLGVTSGNVLVNPAAAAKLTIQTQPSSTASAGTPFLQQPVIRIEDQFGNLRSGDNSTTVTANRSAGSGTLQGVTSRMAVNGVVSFTNLSHTVVTNITILFASGSLASATSTSIAVGPALADRLVFTTQPGNATAGAPFGLQPVIKTRDSFGNDSVESLPASLIVTVNLSSGSGPLQGTASFDIGTAAGNGTLTFADLQIDAAGTNKQLAASASGLTSGLSSIFTVNPAAATKLTIQTQPSGTATAGNAFPTQPVIRIEDQFGNRVTSDNSMVVTASRNAGIASLQGTTSVTAVNGLATFSNLFYNKAETITMDFSGGTLTGATSTNVTVNAAAASKLIVQTQPSSTAVAGVAFAQQPQIRIEDQYGNLRSTDNSTVVTAVRSAGSGTLQGTLNATAVNGLATFANLSHNVANTINLSFSASGLTNATSANIVVSPAAFTKLQLLVPGETVAPGTASGKTGVPSAQTADGSFNVTVNAVDAQWNLVNSASDLIRITSSDVGATLPTNAVLVGGTQSFPITFATTGSQTITATDLTDGSKAPNTSPTITVNAAQHTPATGGGAILADTVGGTWTTLTGPIYTEVASGNVGLGTIILKTPSGFIFDTAGTAPTVKITSGGSSSKNINGAASGSSLAMSSLTSTQLTFTVTLSSSAGVVCTMTWQNVRVRPTAGTPLASGKLSRIGTANVVALTTNSNLGTLREVAGAASRLTILSQPSSSATAGVVFAQQPVLRVEDKYGNLRNATNGTPDNATVITAARNAGSGTLQGALTARATDGVATFTNLSHNVATNITLLFSSGSLTNTTSTAIVVSPAAADRLVFTTQPGLATYGSALNPQPVLKSRDQFGNDSTVDLGASKMVSLAVTTGSGSLLGTTSLDIGTAAGNGTVSFSGLQLSAAGTGKQLSASSSGLTSALSGTFAVAAATVTGNITANNKIYDGTTAASIATRSLSGVVGGDDVSLSGGSASFASKSVGTARTVTATALSLIGTAAGNYQLASTTASTTADITARSLTISAAGINKAYDGTSTATVSLSDNRVAGDSLTAAYVSANFADKNIGTAKSVSVSGIAISGTDATNYSANTTANTTANITARSLSVTATGVNKVYDGTTDATVTLSDNRVAGDSLSTSYTSASFANKNVGTAKSVSVSGIALSGADASNYQLASSTATTTANITAQSLVVSATGVNKVYNGTTSATVTLADNRLSGDVLSASYTSASFANKNVGTAKPVSVNGITISGTDAANYSANTTASTTADITARSLIVSSTGVNKVYDGTANATVTLTDDRVLGDSLNTSYTSASFADQNVGTAKPVSVSGISVTGSDAGNYTFNATASATANITAATVTALVSADNKVYDGTTAATIATRSLNGVLGSDDVSLSGGTASFATKTVGTARTVTASGLSLSGTDASNYQLASTSATTTANITTRSLVVNATGVNKVYNGTTSATVTLSDDRVAGDSLSTSFTNASFANKNVGTAKAVNVSGISVTGTDAGNYTANTTASATADITARSLAVTATGVNKIYDGNTDASATLSDDRVLGDSLSSSYTNASFANKNVGTAKALSVSGISVTGTDAGNYTANSSASATANITAKGLTVTGLAAADKVYDATTSATLNSASAALLGVISGDTVTLSTTGATAAFADKNVGTSKTVNVSALSLSGADAANYSLTQPTTSASITRAGLMVTADDKSRAAGQSNPTLTASYSGFVGGETLATSGVTGSPALSTTTTNVAGTYPITAASGTLSAANYSFSFSNGTLTVTAAAASKLIVQTQPSSTAVAGVAFAQQPQIRIEDQYGNLRSSDNSTVVTAARSAGTGTLQGTLNATAVNGLATFANLSHNVANTINLSFSSSGLTNATSANIVVSPAAFTKLQLLVPGETAAPGSLTGKTGTPAAQVADASFGVTINAVDDFWNLVNTATDLVSLGSSDANATLPPNTALAAGTQSLNVTLNTAGTATLTASDLSDGTISLSTSPAIPVSPAQFTPATGGGAISADAAAAPWMALTGPSYSENASGNVGTGAVILNTPAGFVFDIGGTAPNVLVTRLAGSGSSANNINGVTSLTVVPMTSVTATQLVFTVTSRSASGITCKLTWQNLRVRPAAGTPLADANLTCTGTATVAGVSPSSKFGRLRETAGAANSLALQTQPSITATAGVSFAQQPVLQVRDRFGNLRSAANGAADNSTTISVARGAGSGTLQGTLTAKATDGVATFTNLSHNVATNITLAFSASGLSGTNSSPIAVGPAAAAQLVFITQPGSTTYGAAMSPQPVVRTRDSFGNDSTVGLGTSKQVTLTLTSGTGPLLGTTALDIGCNAGNGMCGFTGVRVDSGGTNKQLTASAEGLSDAASTVFRVDKQSQTITFDVVGNKSYGDAPFNVSATASSGLPVTFSIVSGPAAMAGGLVSVTGVGAVTVRAAQAGDGDWAAAAPVERSFTVAKATLTVTAENKSRTYGSPNPALTASYSGFVNGESANVLSGSPSLSTTATTGSSVGGSPYTIIVAQGTLTAANYSFNFVPGALTITPAQITVVANDAARPYGQANPAFNGTLSGIKNGDNVTATYTTSAIAGSPAGTYDIVPSLSDPDGKLNNYTVATTSGVLTVGKATLTVTADNQTRVYGAPNPSLTASYTGFVAGDSESALSGSPDLSTTATAASPVAGGPYPITASRGTLGAANYDFTFLPGQLTITPASVELVTITSANPSPTGSNVTFTARVSGIAPSSGVPSGTVQFTADGSALGEPVNLQSGAASLTLASLSHGLHTIAATYAGDGNFSATASELGLDQVINFAPRTTLATYTRAGSASIQIAIQELLASHATDADGDELTLVSVGSGTNGATVLLFGGSISYQPSDTDPNRNTTDHLDYVVTDGFPGGTVTNQIRIQLEVQAPAAPAVFAGLTAGAGGVRLSFSGSAGYTYQVERAVRLESGTLWTRIGAATTDSVGHGEFTDSNPPAEQAFYRAVWP